MGSKETSVSSLGDESGGLSEFMGEAREDLVALAYVMTGSQEEAQDVVHDVFVRLLRTDLAGVADLRSYARRAVTNECATWGRRLARSARRSRQLRAEWDRVLSTQPDPFGRIEVLSAMTALSARQRAAMVLRYYLDWDDAAIAETLNCAPATVRTLISRALKRLRTELTERGASS